MAQAVVVDAVRTPIGRRNGVRCGGGLRTGMLLEHV